MCAGSLVVLIAAVLSVVITSSAEAQPLTAQVDSLELRVSNARLIYLATISNIDPDPSRSGWGELVFQVDESIKGPFQATRQLPAHYLTESLLKSHAEGTSVLVIDGGKGNSQVAIPLGENQQVEVLTADLRVIRSPAELITAVREIAQDSVGIIRRQAFEVLVAEEVVADTQWAKYYRTGGHIRLNLPVDPHLEQLAQQWVTGNARQRAQGAEALRYFKTEENIQRVRSLLNDPSESIQVRTNDGQRQEERGLFVQEAAKETLRYWGL
ncbi:hypothetical protein AB1L30_24145 [Bremerella sp. JC817]|uniref:hypothetical protein n=1 Tax=Bremerella sp. JC817 TaxID=3231756 RepID=UPI0034595C1A